MSSQRAPFHVRTNLSAPSSAAQKASGLPFPDLAQHFSLVPSEGRARALEMLTSPNSKRNSPAWNQALNIITAYLAFLYVIDERASDYVQQSGVSIKGQKPYYDRVNSKYERDSTSFMHSPPTTFQRDGQRYFEMCDAVAREAEPMKDLYQAYTLGCLGNCVSQIICTILDLASNDHLGAATSARAEELGRPLVTFDESEEEEDDDMDSDNPVDRHRPGIASQQSSSSKRISVSDLGVGDVLSFTTRGTTSQTIMITETTQSARRGLIFMVSRNGREEEEQMNAEAMEQVLKSGNVKLL